MQAPEPGIFENISLGEYLSWDACSHSALEDMRRSAAYCYWRKTHPSESTEAKNIGNAMHTATLEPDKFEQLYIKRPDGDARKLEKNGGCKEAYDEAKASGKILLTADEIEGCFQVAGQIQVHPVFGPILRDGQKELCVVADLNGLRCKIRLDCYSNGSVIDIKKTVQAGEAEFPRQISRYGHHRQAALYSAVMEGRDLPMNAWYWAAIQASEPWEMNPMEIDPDALELGYVQNSLLLARYADCLRTGQWPGFDQTIKRVGCAPWETDAEDDFELEDQG